MKRLTLCKSNIPIEMNLIVLLSLTTLSKHDPCILLWCHPFNPRLNQESISKRAYIVWFVVYSILSDQPVALLGPLIKLNFRNVYLSLPFGYKYVTSLDIYTV